MNIEIILTENQIEALINGEEISKRAANGHVVNIRQSYLKDIAMPIINRRNKVVDTYSKAVMNKQFYNELKSLHLEKLRSEQDEWI